MSEDYPDLYNEATEVTTEKLIDHILSNPPQTSCSIGLLPEFDDNEPDATSCIFELLVDIYIEAIIDGERLYKMLETNRAIERRPVTKVDIYNIKKEYLEIPIPWFKSFGFTITVSEYESSDFNKMHALKLIPHLYYKLLLRDNPNDNGYFVKKNINRPYHFIKNADYVNTNKIEDMSLLIVKPRNFTIDDDISKCFVVSFSVYQKF